MSYDRKHLFEILQDLVLLGLFIPNAVRYDINHGDPIKTIEGFRAMYKELSPAHQRFVRAAEFAYRGADPLPME